MKKFYYKKEDSLDKTPIILRLDRRQTVNVNKDGVRDEIGRYLSRATSISSLEQLKDVPTLPRARIREATKSLSDDIFRNYSTPSTVIITETELSSSWLYENMKAVANSREEKEYQTPKSPRSSTNQPSLSPVMLQDPKMKPIPVPSKPRPEKTSSCCCYMAIMIAISICTLGFLSTIGGIIYLELFTNKDSIVNKTTDTPIDELGVLRRAQTEDSNGTQELNNQNTVSNELEDDSSKYKSEELNDSIAVEDHQRKTIHFLDFGKPISTELTQFIDNTRREIRFHKDESRLYEEKSSNSFEYDGSSNVAQHIVDYLSHDVYMNQNEIKNNSTENNMTEVIDEKIKENLEKFEAILINQSNSVAEENEYKEEDDILILINQSNPITERNEMNVTAISINQSNSVTEENERKELASSNAVLHLDQADDLKKLESGTESRSKVSVEHMEQEPVTEGDLEKIEGQNIIDDEVPKKGSLTDLEIQPDLSDQEKPVIENFNESPDKYIVEATDRSEIELNEVKETKNFIEKGVINSQYTESNVDDSILTVINDSNQDAMSEESKVFPNRHGDVLPIFETVNSSKIRKPARINIELKRRASVSPDFAQRFQQEMPQDKMSKRPVDIKVSLAEALKHLQVLDVKLPSSRTKSVKPKVKNTKLKSQNNIKQKQMETMEQMRYLQKLRLIFDQMQ